MPEEQKGLLHIAVSAQKPRFSFEQKNEWTNEYAIHVTAKAADNKANLELQRELTRLFQARARIVKGLKSSHKIVEVNLPQNELDQKIQQLNSRQTKTKTKWLLYGKSLCWSSKISSQN